MEETYTIWTEIMVEFGYVWFLHFDSGLSPSHFMWHDCVVDITHPVDRTHPVTAHVLGQVASR